MGNAQAEHLGLALVERVGRVGPTSRQVPGYLAEQPDHAGVSAAPADEGPRPHVAYRSQGAEAAGEPRAARARLPSVTKVCHFEMPPVPARTWFTSPVLTSASACPSAVARALGRAARPLATSPSDQERPPFDVEINGV